ncbi:MAG: hypothetical protein KJZ80_17935 [Hyphomicrobiaceae bacterium]|nr:hypothetical protein [Hyphomicrobiaceae bacterium]
MGVQAHPAPGESDGGSRLSTDGRNGRGQGFRNWPALLILSMLVLTNGALVAAWSAGHAVALGKEHGFLEYAQLALVLPAFLLFWRSWRHGRDSDRTAAGALAMLVAAAFVREIDVKTLGGPEWFWWLSHHGLQEILLVAMTLPILWYLARNWRQWRGLLRLLFAPAAIPLVLAGTLLMISVYLDRRVVVEGRMRFWEEFIELNGYLFLLVSAWNHWVIVRRHSADPGCGP